ncbi:sulfatase [Marinilabilia salmonicolor]|jgi:arylsulfatase A-like enzyme|uniref:Arylsulfatase A-like enzyme n=1 Tax=Marinilabilia salmonicolor TaxID=989 RepID=A0A2T0XC08_9BACT|nr:sulfatase [Marinilabilia salmonicolor]PRY96429.1 arylsulfatase A-like enzyme [Marinilabilia salmonicolor]RCW37604.1 arylsulfatase A-like enzyme [Marinilabilia salmonicolor]
MKKIGNISLGIGVLMAAMTGCQSAEEPQSPNLVYVFPDQMRKQAMEFWETPEYEGAIRTKGDPVKTPNLNKFAQESVIFTNMVSNSPLCTPHRGSLFTGLYPGSSGAPLNCNSNRPVSSLRTDVVGFTDVISQAGYETAYIGKWHLDFPTPNDPANPGHYVDPRTPAWDTYTPPERRHGIDYWYAYNTWDVHLDPHYYDTDGNRFDPRMYSPQHEADKAIEYLQNKDGQRDPDKPFALFVSMNPPHSPYSSLDDCLEKDYNIYKDIPIENLLHRPNVDHSMAKTASAPYYFANVTGVDREFGRIVQQLKEMGEYENTIIVFTSDHGETMCSQGVTDPKNSIYSESMDVPFLIRWPELNEARTDNLIMSTPDIMPTILSMMGLEKLLPDNLHGFDYSEQIISEKEDNRPESALYIRNLDGEVNEAGKVISYFPEARGIKTHHFSLELVIDRNHNLVTTRFFNDNQDPYQMNNMPVDWNDEQVKGLLKEMAFWLKHSDDLWYKKNILSDLIPYN